MKIFSIEKIKMFVTAILLIFASNCDGASMCLETDDYAIKIEETCGKELLLRGSFVNSSMKFVKYSIFKKNEKVFIRIYGRYISVFDTQTNGDFVIRYFIPDDVKAVYLNGILKNDKKNIWEKEDPAKE